MSLLGRVAALPAAALLAFVVAAAPAAAAANTPEAGSPVRAAVLEALRRMVEAEVGAPVEFVVNDLRVLGEWAFVDAMPQRPGGGPIFYIYSRYQARVNAGAFGETVVALLRETPAGWLVYEYSLGATDVVWLGWVGLHPTPPEVFPPH